MGPTRGSASVLLTNHQRGDPEFLDPREGRRGLRARPSAFALQAVRNGLEPPFRPFSELLVIHVSVASST
jgi:hypothetical protein